MITSDSIKELATALNLAQGQMTAAKKDAANPFFKSKYADLGSVIMAIKEAFFDNGLSYIQAPIMAEHSVGVVTRIMHSSGEWIEETLTLPLVKMDPQSAGSAITYARRYALQSMAGVPAADDDAEFAMGRHKEPEKPAEKPQPTITQDQEMELAGALVAAGISLDDFCKKGGVKSLDLLMASRYEGALKWAQKMDLANV